MLSVIFFPAFFVGQNIKQEIINLNKMHYKEANASIEVVSKVFEDNNPKAIQESKVISYKARGKYRYVNGSSESMANDDFKINVDHNRKIIIVSKINKKTLEEKNPDLEGFDKKSFALALDTVLNLYKDISIKKVDESINEISFVLKQGNFDVVTVSYDSKTYKVLQCFVKLKPVSGQQHNYSCRIKYNYLPNESPDSEKFDESNFITVQKKKIAPVSKYAQYKLIDHSNQKG